MAQERRQILGPEGSYRRRHKKVTGFLLPTMSTDILAIAVTWQIPQQDDRY